MKITGILPEAVTLAAYRDAHLYVVQGRQVLILRPDGNLTQRELEFAPDRFASYAGSFVLLGPGGVCRFNGSDLTLADERPGSVYTAPLAEPVRDGTPLNPSAPWRGGDVMGMPVERAGPVTHCPLTGRSYYDPVLGAELRPDRLLTFTRSQHTFGELNGVQGPLVFRDVQTLPDLLVPYSYPQGNLHGAGFQGGYVFTPDSGRSWLSRKLTGFGVLTERAVLSVSPEEGVRVITGVHP